MFFSRVFVRTYALVRKFEHTLQHWRVEHARELNKRTGVFLLLVFLAGLSVYIEWVRPPANFPQEELVTVEEGVPLGALALYLEEQHVVRNAFALEVVARLLGGNTAVRAGDYIFKSPKNVVSVAHALITGNFGLEPTRIRIPEGATLADIAQIYDKYLLRFEPNTFIQRTANKEGYLFPDTYYFLPNATEEAVATAMENAFENKVADLLPDIAESGHTLEEIVIMASLIEKEAWKEDDQRLISGVLWNRIERGMLLQVDATFTYTHNKGTYQITMAELTDEENPYNTYVHKGLPPGAICSPGYSALYAAVHPIESDYLFYLADKDGITHFSATYEEHLQKKRLYID